MLQLILDNMINKGQLTKNEQKDVLVQLQEKLDAVDTQIEAAVAAGQAKKEAKLREVRSRFPVPAPWLVQRRGWAAHARTFAHCRARRTQSLCLPRVPPPDLRPFATALDP